MQIDAKSNHEEEVDAQEDMDMFSDNFNVAFVKSLLRLQNQVVNLPNSKEHYDIYLGKSLYPVLVPAIEELSKEITRIIEEQDTIDPSIRARFNPCIFLAEYLMRNNPDHGAKLEYKDLFEQQAGVEKLRRFFNLKRQKIFKHFTLQPYHSNFTYENVEKYTEVLDAFLMQNGKLHRGFSASHTLEASEDPTAQVGFDAFYDALSKWGCQQTEISYDDFSLAETNP